MADRIGYADKVSGGNPKGTHNQQWWHDDANESKNAINNHASLLDGNTPVYIKTAPVDWETVTPTFPEASAIRVAINGMADKPTNVIPDNHIVAYRTIRVDYGVSRSEYRVYTNIWIETRKYPYSGTDAPKIGTNGNVTLNANTSALELINEYEVLIINGIVQNNGLTIDVGDTGSTSIETVVDGRQNMEIMPPTIFSGTDGTNAYLYLYIGDELKLGTTSGVTTSLSDYRLLTPETVDAPPITAPPKPELRTGNIIKFDVDTEYNRNNPHTSGVISIDTSDSVDQTAATYPVMSITEPTVTVNNSGYIFPKHGKHSSSKLNYYYFFQNITGDDGIKSYTQTITQNEINLSEAPRFTMSSDSPTQNRGTIEAVTGASSYYVVHNTVNDISSAVELTSYNGTDLQFIHSGLTEGTIYYYWTQVRFTSAPPSLYGQKAIVAATPFTEIDPGGLDFTGIDSESVTVNPTPITNTNWAGEQRQNNIYLKEENGALGFKGRVDSGGATGTESGDGSGDGYLMTVASYVFDASNNKAFVFEHSVSGSVEQAFRITLNNSNFSSQLMLRNDLLTDVIGDNELKIELKEGGNGVVYTNLGVTWAGKYQIVLFTDTTPKAKILRSTDDLTWTEVTTVDMDYETYTFWIQSRYPSRNNCTRSIEYVKVYDNEVTTV